MAEPTPMMRQYMGIRRSLPADTLLLFRLGDFYEMFFEDAKTAASILNVALTKRGQVPMCGVPYHAADGYINKLISAGKHVAIADQVSEPRPGQIVQREVTQVISPGTVSDLNLLDARRNNYLAAIHWHQKRYGLAFADMTTGEFRLTEFEALPALEDELARVAPAEVLVSEEGDAPLPTLLHRVTCEGYFFHSDQALFTLCEQFGVQSLDGYGATGMPAATGAAGALLHYLKHQMRRNISHISGMSVYRHDQFMTVDAASQLNLELVTSRGGGRNVSLLSALDRTVTPMGARLLRHWVLHPLLDSALISARQDAIGSLLADTTRLGSLREALGGIRDVERSLGRLTQSSGNPRDMLALKSSLDQLPDLRARLEPLAHQSGTLLPEPPAPRCAMMEEIYHAIGEFPQLTDLLIRALVDEPPLTLKDGGIFREGYDPMLDELRAACRDGRDWIANLQQREIEATGIKSLKIRYTSVFGYFIEVTKANLSLVPEHYTRKQTTANSERFITAELKEMEGKILGAEERSRQLEQELFVRLREIILDESIALQQMAQAIGRLDAIASLAETARLFDYCRPVINTGLNLIIRNGRHPVLDQNVAEERFVPNDVRLDGEQHRLHIITGPNMAGKSTFIRQVALITLMAQIGSFVPASAAEVGITDRIFTRVGASDDLSRGQSTFMVEMNETANILNNATERSLVILDEIGRGTSTFDGLSIAWSVAEHLHNRLRSRTLFATHYHELTELELTLPGVKNFNVAVREWNDQIIFLRKIISGGADKSYGIQVARLAGLPKTVIERAKEVLANLEAGELNADGTPLLAQGRNHRSKGKPGGGRERPQLSLF